MFCLPSNAHLTAAALTRQDSRRRHHAKRTQGRFELGHSYHKKHHAAVPAADAAVHAGTCTCSAGRWSMEVTLNMSVGFTPREQPCLANTNKTTYMLFGKIQLFTARRSLRQACRNQGRPYRMVCVTQHTASVTKTPTLRNHIVSKAHTAELLTTDNGRGLQAAGKLLCRPSATHTGVGTLATSLAQAMPTIHNPRNPYTKVGGGWHSKSMFCAAAM